MLLKMLRNSPHMTQDLRLMFEDLTEMRLLTKEKPTIVD